MNHGEIRRPRLLIAEAWRTSRSHPGTAILTALIVAAMTAAVLLTNGRMSGAQRDLLSSFDQAGGRVILIEPGSRDPLESTQLTRLQTLNDIEWVGAFGVAHDLHNTAIPGGATVPVREFATTNPARLGIPTTTSIPDAAYASATALAQAGMTSDRAGGLRDADGTTASVIGQLQTPGFLTGFEPLVLQPVTSTDTFPCSIIVVIATDLTVVDALAAALPTYLGTDAKVTASSELLAIRAQVEQQLGALGNGLVVAALTTSALLVAVIQLVLVLVSRRDYGRRRALGARQSTIVGLVGAKSAIEGLLGALAGTLIADTIMLAAHDPLPGPVFHLSVATLAIATAVIGSLAPAWFASQRDPLTELRVP